MAECSGHNIWDIDLRFWMESSFGQCYRYEMPHWNTPLTSPPPSWKLPFFSFVALDIAIKGHIVFAIVLEIGPWFLEYNPSFINFIWFQDWIQDCMQKTKFLSLILWPKPSVCILPYLGLFRGKKGGVGYLSLIFQNIAQYYTSCKIWGQYLKLYGHTITPPSSKVDS